MNSDTGTTRKKQWNNIGILTFIFFAALAARLAKLILDPMLQRDSANYLAIAEMWQDTGCYTQVIMEGNPVPPLPLFIIVKLMDWGLGAEVAGRSTALFLGAMIAVLGYCISCKLFKDPLIPSISAFLFIFHPTLISYSIQPLRENFYLFFLGLTIVEIIEGIQYRSFKNWGLSGIFLAFALFCRYESMELLLICPMVLLYLSFRKRIDFRRAVSLIGVFLSACIITSSLLLSITNYDIAFLTKVSKYTDKVIQQNNVRSIIEKDSQNLE